MAVGTNLRFEPQEMGESWEKESRGSSPKGGERRSRRGLSPTNEEGGAKMEFKFQKLPTPQRPKWG